MKRYLLAFLLKPVDNMDRSCGGVSSVPFMSFYVPCETGPTTEEDMKQSSSPHCILELKDEHTNIPYFQPVGTQGRPQFGGCFINAMDSRFTKTYGYSPIHLYDRVE